MTDAPIDPRYLEVFPSWLRTLGEDTLQMAAAVGKLAEANAHEGVQKYLVAGANYIFKSLDLIPDGIDDLGYMDDAFVVRVAAALAVAEDASAKEGVVGRLADDAHQVRDFLGADYTRLEEYVKGLRRGAARGRTVDDIVGDAEIRTTFLHELAAWGKDYQMPSFARDPKTLIKLKAFLSAKLA